MKFDETAVKMLNAFIDNEHLTSTELTKLVFDINNRTILQKKNNLIISRLKTWVKKGLIVNGTIENRIAHYKLNEDNLKMGTLLLRIDDDFDELGEYLVIDIKGQPRILAPLDLFEE
ncbi:hypothetical protein LCGC14_0797840 [marine sediment metagenome]|uniref:Uncharacterized protein n=1 Tax=marine sediment metagenome TaxID=412755 RepID=A0A0F9SXS5_9ZZZZ